MTVGVQEFLGETHRGREGGGGEGDLLDPHLSIHLYLRTYLSILCARDRRQCAFVSQMRVCESERASRLSVCVRLCVRAELPFLLKL